MPDAPGLLLLQKITRPAPGPRLYIGHTRSRRDCAAGKSQNTPHRTSPAELHHMSRHFSGKMPGVTRILAEHFPHDPFRFAVVIPVSGVEIVDAMLKCILDDLSCLLLVYGTALADRWQTHVAHAELCIIPAPDISPKAAISRKCFANKRTICFKFSVDIWSVCAVY